MALDPVPTYPGQYNTNEALNNPDGSETRKQGDDQIRRMKASEAHTWANITGPVTVTQAEINALGGVDTGVNVETRLKYLEDAFPVNTRIAFFQASIPATGWAQDVDDAILDNRMLRIRANGQGAGIGGASNPVYMTGADVPQHPHGASASVNGDHFHNLWYYGGSAGFPGQAPFNVIDAGGVDSYWNLNSEKINHPQQSMQVNGNHNHTITVSNNTGPTVWEPRYIDFVIGVKT